MTPSPELLAVAEACERMAQEAIFNAEYGEYNDEFRETNRKDATTLRAHVEAIRAGRILHIQPRDPDDEGGVDR